MKKYFLFIYVLIISFSALAASTQIGKLYYAFSGSYASVTNSKGLSSTDSDGDHYTDTIYEIPETVQYEGLSYTVTEIASQTFSRSNIKYIKLPKTIIKISEGDTEQTTFKGDKHGAFFSTGLVNIIIPSNVTLMGKHCFDKCDKLRTIIYTSNTAPTNWTMTSKTYVPNKNNYSNPSVIINSGTIIEMISWTKNEFIYDGNPIELPSFINNLEEEGFQVSYNTNDLVLNNKIGTHTIQIPMKFSNNNESFNVDIPFTYTIKGCPLVISVENSERIYGEENPSFNIKYDGFVNGEDENSLLSKPTITTVATQKSDVGTYLIDISGAKSEYYDISYEPGSLTIKKAPLTAKVCNSSKEYGTSNPNFSLEYLGLKNSESTPSWTISPSYTTSATNYSSVGEYEVSATATPKNYELSEIASGKLIVTPAPLTIQANNISKVYYAENPDLTYSCHGLKNGEDKTILFVQPKIETNATKESDAGSYDITIGGTSAQNYNITYQNGKMTIQKRTLNVSIGNYERNYGEENPDFSIEYEGFAGSEDLSIIDTEPYPYTSATKDTKVGIYPIYITGGSDNNYTFNYYSGKLTINKAEQDIIWNQDLTNLAIGEQVKLLAESTSGLQITYSLDQNSICEIYVAGKSTYLDCKAEGEIQIKAYQEGNENYYPTPRTFKKIVVSSSAETKPSLTIKQPDLGSISTKVARGSSYEFTITPDNEWLVHSISFNGNDYTSKLDKTNTFTTPQITTNSTITIIYTKKSEGAFNTLKPSIKIIGTPNGIQVAGAKANSNICIYTIDGLLIKQDVVDSDIMNINLEKDKLYIVTIDSVEYKIFI